MIDSDFRKSKEIIPADNLKTFKTYKKELLKFRLYLKLRIKDSAKQLKEALIHCHCTEANILKWAAKNDKHGFKNFDNGLTIDEFEMILNRLMHVDKMKTFLWGAIQLNNASASCFQAGLLTAALECSDCVDGFLQPANHENTSLQHQKFMESTFRDSKKNLAKVGALARHKKTNEKREEIKKFFCDHIYPSNPNISNEKAGEWLKDTFTTLSVRKLSEYAREAKKEMKDLPPASKT